MTRSSPSRPKALVIGIDGTPFSFLQQLMQQGEMPHLAQLVREGDFREMDSSYPPISSVAWSCFMTGQNPGKHGIFGFVDRQPATMKSYIPTARHLRVKMLWELLSEAGRRVLVMNVPVTYPPRPVNGILVGDFLSPSLEKATYPTEVSQQLKSLGYIIDIDPWEARRNKTKLLQDVSSALEARERALFALMAREAWDYVHCHVMETDRLHHFLWEEMEAGDPRYAPGFLAFYRQLDGFLGRVRERLDKQTTLVILSDHGFCTLRKEVYVNYWLREQGWLRFRNDPPKSLEDLAPDTAAYAVDPARIFINLRGREATGSVEPGAAYEQLREQIIAAALGLTDPESGAPIIQKAFRREELYHGPFLEQAADVILHAYDGYDLKGALFREQLTFKGPELVGMHTHENAALYVRGQRLTVERPWIADVAPTLLQLMQVPLPADLDGRVLLA